MEDVKIRKIKLEDLDDFYTLFSNWVRTQFPEYDEKMVNYLLANKNAYTKENYREKIKKQTRFLIGAFVNNKITGMLDAAPPNTGLSFCSWLIVDPDMQKRGIGKKLLKEWEEEMKKQGVHALYLVSDDRNITYYEKLGFTHIGKFKKAWFGVDTNYLSKQIQEPRGENYLK